MVADYDLLRQNIFKWNQLKAIHEKEVYYPEKPQFPFFEARNLALKTMSDPNGSLPSVPDITLPFEEEVRGYLAPKPALDIKPPPIRSPYRLTLNRLVKFGETPGCKGCRSIGTERVVPHSAECKERFAKL